MEAWQESLRQAIGDPKVLAGRFGLEASPLEEAAKIFPMRITPHYYGLIREPGDPIWRQCVPDVRELRMSGLPDPLSEEALSPVPSVIHRYPDRVVLLASGSCAVYCRFCTRKRKVGCPSMNLTRRAILDGIDYIASTPEVREVLLSGGDPLLLSDDRLGEMLESLRSIPHLEVLRIGTRVPVVLPERITGELCSLLRGFHPLYINTHFNHPREITPEAADACSRLAEAGIPLGNQTVLLRRVNDDSSILAELFRGLLRIRVKPYYLHHMDLTAGTGHFRTRLETGMEILRKLRGPLSGMGIPHYVVDTPGGKGKVPILPEYVEEMGDTAILRTPDGEKIHFCNRIPE